MSKNKYEREKRIKDCKQKMTIKNLSGKRIKVTIESLEGESIQQGDLEVTIDGSWDLDIKAARQWVDEIIAGDKETGYLTIIEEPIA